MHWILSMQILGCHAFREFCHTVFPVMVSDVIDCELLTMHFHIPVEIYPVGPLSTLCSCVDPVML